MKRESQPANDNAVTEISDSGPDPKASNTASSAATLNRVTFDIARLIGRQLAREDHDRRTAANDNEEGDRTGD